MCQVRGPPQNPLRARFRIPRSRRQVPSQPRVPLRAGTPPLAALCLPPLTPLPEYWGRLVQCAPLAVHDLATTDATKHYRVVRAPAPLLPLQKSARRRENSTGSRLQPAAPALLRRTASRKRSSPAAATLRWIRPARSSADNQEAARNRSRAQSRRSAPDAETARTNHCVTRSVRNVRLDRSAHRFAAHSFAAHSFANHWFAYHWFGAHWLAAPCLAAPAEHRCDRHSPRARRS